MVIANAANALTLDERRPTNVATCFVIQPFDSGRYDKRYRECFKPAIELAGLTAYRVDEDPRVDVGIESIESGIRNSVACLADISEDNANVWYELGFAMALGKPVVMVCSEQARSKFPFDIQHRIVTRYKSDSPSDFAELQVKISERLSARATHEEMLKQAAASEQVAVAGGLSSPELMLIAAVASETESPEASSVLWRIKEAAERQGLTPIGFQLALQRLRTKEFVRVVDEFDAESERAYKLVSLTQEAWAWIDLNEERFVTQRRKKRTPVDDFADDDIPF